MIPGRLLHRIATRICSAKSVDRVVEPAIVDLQLEYSDGSSRGWWWIRRLVANYLAILCVIGICTLEVTAMTDERPIKSTLLSACALIALMTILFMLPPLSVFPEVRGWYAFIAVVPQALPLAIPAGLAFALAYGLSGRATMSVTKIMLLVAFGGSLFSFGVMAWGMPAGNQAFRELALQADAAKFQRPIQAPLQKGPNEMTLSELRRESQNVASEGEHGRARWYSWTFYLRFTLPAAVIAVAAFMLLVPVQGRAVRAAIAFAMCLFYWALIYVGEFGVRRDYLAPSIGAWLPNMALVLCAMLAGPWHASRFGASRLRSR
jgi:hypothetical protein